MPAERDARGVKLRRFPGGDAFAKVHRVLGRDAYMVDVDALLLFEQLAAAPRRFFGLIECKRTIAAAYEPDNRPAFSFLLHLARIARSTSFQSSRMLLRLGVEPPWILREINVETCGKIADYPLRNLQDLGAVLDNIGLAPWDFHLGCDMLGLDTDNRLLIEFQPDDVANIKAFVRQHAAIAFFARYADREQFDKDRSRKLPLYAEICRLAAAQQGIVQPHLYAVLGGDEPPWYLGRLDLRTFEVGQKLALRSLSPQEWSSAWERLGLWRLREEAVRMLRASSPPRQVRLPL
jgi:hypothetical protein